MNAAFVVAGFSGLLFVVLRALRRAHWLDDPPSSS